MATNIEDTLDIWHARIEYLGEQNFKRLAKTSNLFYMKKSYQECSAMRKQLKSPIRPFSPDTYPNDFVHSDLVGPLSLLAGEVKYFVTFLDDYTGLITC